MKHTLGLVIGVLLLASVAVAQMEPMKPGPELKKLDYFVGHWSSDGDIKPGPMGPGGKTHLDEKATWMEGGFFVVIHSTYTMPGASKDSKGTKGSAIAFMGYDPEEKVYTYDEFNSMGEATHSKGTVDGDNWSWVNDMKMGGKTMKGRFSMKIVSPTTYSYKFEMSTDATNWTMVMDGKDVKVK